ncbi:MAG: tRNA (adenosine(37)-N6)-dimethylallyltransferase MiaA [Candidatus Eremiobacteraeota bacterium]|nr:tRNA (adenosine(37)-N6)-dimethylallyltransferase MiaA [Candidatus Eremiobacteraeota bacterium]
MSENSGILIVTGATATGKSTLAVQLARRFEAEIIGADSRQIYRDMSIGTAAPSKAQRAEVPHHLVAFLDPRERYSAAQFTLDALTAIEDLGRRAKRAIVVGGTGFYIRALCGEVSLAPQYDRNLRRRLQREVALHPPEVLHAWLSSIDPQRASVISSGDTYRIVRSLEVVLAENQTRDEPLASLRGRGIPFVKACLCLPTDVLEKRISERVDTMLRSGLLDEAERIGINAVAASAVGYPQALGYLRGLCTEGELRKMLFRATRRYAKRQQTWFRSERDIHWCCAQNALEAVSALARERLQWV